MGRLNRRDDSLLPESISKCLHRLVIGDGYIFGSAQVIEVGVLRPNSGIVQPGRNGVDRGNLPIAILAEVGFHAVKNTQLLPY